MIESAAYGKSLINKDKNVNRYAVTGGKDRERERKRKIERDYFY